MSDSAAIGGSVPPFCFLVTDLFPVGLLRRSTITGGVYFKIISYFSWHELRLLFSSKRCGCHSSTHVVFFVLFCYWLVLLLYCCYAGRLPGEPRGTLVHTQDG